MPSQSHRPAEEEWSIETYCSSAELQRRQQQQHKNAGSYDLLYYWDDDRDDWRLRAPDAESSSPSSVLEFLRALQLKPVHPFCRDGTAPRPYQLEGVPRQGPLLGSTTNFTTWWASTTSTTSSKATTAQSSSSPSSSFHHRHHLLEILVDVCVTMFVKVVPPLWAMTELWLRLFASAIAPLGIARLLLLLRARTNKSEPATSASTASTCTIIWCVLTLASSTVVATDTLYVLEFGPNYGLILTVASTWLAWKQLLLLPVTKTIAKSAKNAKRNGTTTTANGTTKNGASASRKSLKTATATTKVRQMRFVDGLRAMLLRICVFLPLAWVFWSRFVAVVGSIGSTHNRYYPENAAADSELATISEGLYYDDFNSFASRVANNWPQHKRRYDFFSATDSTDESSSSSSKLATPWMPTGDARTGLPFLMNKVKSPEWLRVWLPTSSDGEVVALDIAFPPAIGGDVRNDGIRGARFRHDKTKPVYLVLHGLNGGSAEEYVKDFAHRRLEEGSTVVVMVARGLMDLPIRGWNIFHGARTSDVGDAAAAVRAALERLVSSSSGRSRASADQRQLLVGVGYSMGAIVLANYAARSGKDCQLDMAVTVSGGLDLRYEINFTRAQRLWQPILTKELRETFILGKWGERVRKRLTTGQFKAMMRAYHITDFDRTAVVAYNRFRDLDHYYSEMSALGDIPLEQHHHSNVTSGTVAPTARINGLSIPLCVVHALDDPLVTWRTVAANEGLLHPGTLSKAVGNGNLFLLLTKRGG